MRSTSLSAAALLLAGLRAANAQTFTSCNPLTSTTCPSDPGLGTTITTDFTAGANSFWVAEAGTTLQYGPNGAEFIIKAAADAPTIGSNKYIFFGQVQAVLRAAPGQGIVSSFILESDDLDEIDWEWLGSTDTSVESNFFGKGNTTTYDRAIYHNVADPIGTWHTYTIDWTSAYIKWSIDGNLVRTLNYGDALALGGKNFPQTPMKVKMGNWVGCADAAANQPSSPTYGTCQWAGGPANFAQAPFTMYVKSVTVQDYGCGGEYTYSDESGSWQSIKSSGTCGSSGSSAGSSGATSASSSVQTSSGAQFAQSTTSSSSGSTSVASTSSNSSIASTTLSTSTGSGSAATTTSSSSTTPNTTTSAPAKVSSNSASTLTSKSKYGALDVIVMAFGLALGYFVM